MRSSTRPPPSRRTAASASAFPPITAPTGCSARADEDQKLLTASSPIFRSGADQFYGRGWLLTHYLTLHPARKGQLSAYVGLINRGTDSLAAAKQVFGDLAALDKELNRYVRQRTLGYLRLPAAEIATGPITLRELTAGEAAVIDLRIRSKRGVNAAEAKALLPLVRKAAAPHPRDVMAQVTLAEAAFDAGAFAEAEAAADRALAADARSVEALIYKGRVRMALAAQDKDANAATWREVRKWFLAANRIENDDPEPLMLFYSSFLAAGEKPTANATLGLEQALGLAPQDSSLRWMLALQKLRDGKGDDARRALAPVAFDPHGGEAAKAASEVLAKLDAGGVAAALEAFEALPGKEAVAGSVMVKGRSGR
jgi:hypothetical protein